MKVQAAVVGTLLVLILVGVPVSADDNVTKIIPASLPPASVTKLVMVQVIFSHGDRTPDILYPNDIYTDEHFDPFGMGQLVSLGRRRAYDLGKTLRLRYDSFLGSVFRPSQMEVTTIDTDRSKGSADLTMAGLWPPTGQNVWGAGIGKLWMPIPHDTVPLEDDHILLPLVSPCPRRYDEQKKVESSPEVTQKILELFHGKDLLEYYRDHIGWNLTTAEEFYNAYNILKIEEEVGLALPSWTKKVYPEPANSAAQLMINLYTSTRKMRRLWYGSLAKLMLKKARDAERKHRAVENFTPFVAFSANDATVLSLLRLFHLLHRDDYMPFYSSALMIELHREVKTDTYGFKFFYLDPKVGDVVAQLYPQECEEFCSLERFTKLISDDLPDSLEEECTM